MFFNHKLFVQKFLNNELEQIQDLDQLIYWDDIQNILDEIKDIQQDKFILEDTIKKLILDCSYYLPYIAFTFNELYTFDKIFSFKSIFIIYKNHIYRKRNYFFNKKTYYFILRLLNYPNIYPVRPDIKHIKEEYKQKINCINNINLLPIKEIRQLYIYSLYEYKKMIKNNCYCNYYILPEILADFYLSLNTNNQSIVNILTHFFIIDIQRIYEQNIKKIHINYSSMLKIINMNWNIIKNKYKSIIKININKWYQYLEKNKYKYINDFYIYLEKFKNH